MGPYPVAETPITPVGTGVLDSGGAELIFLCTRIRQKHLLAERGIIVSREAIRLWYPKHSLRSWGRLCIKFGAIYSRRLNRNHRGYGDTLYIDEVFVKIIGKQQYLWRAVD